MDLSAKSLSEVEFREAKKGYDHEEVDEFVARAVEVVQELHARLRDATERANRAEQQRPVTGGGAPSESEETLKRTLVLAQRTADLAIQEAREQADSLLSKARQEANELVQTATESARRTSQEAQQQLRSDVSRLEVARDQLQSDIGALESYVEKQRARLQETLSNALRAIEEGIPRDQETPDLRHVEVPPDTMGGGYSSYGGGSTVPASSGAAGFGAPEPAPAATPPASSPPTSGAAGFGDAPERYAPDRSALVGLGGDAVAPTRADEDPYLAELRRAVVDSEPLGPRDNDDETTSAASDPFFKDDDDDDDDEGDHRLGSRLRRRN